MWRTGCTKPGAPASAVQRLVEEVDVIGLRRINKSSMLAAVDGLREGAVQEHILHIELMNRSGVGDS
jgi:hypothetical protein